MTDKEMEDLAKRIFKYGSDENNYHERLSSGEKVLCPKCHQGYFVPYKAPADKAHWFECSNPNCDCHYHWDPAIFIE